MWFVYKVLKECKLWYTVVEVYFILLIFTVTKTDYLTKLLNLWHVFGSFKCWWLFSGFCELPSFFFYSQCDTCLLCLKLPYTVYTYTSNCWINSSINITLEPQPAFTTLTTCAGLFHILKFHKYRYIVLHVRYSSTLLTYFTLW